MNRLIKNIIIIGTLWLLFVLVMFPKECIDAGLRGVFLCLDTVIPSLFPFFVCSGLITGFNLTKSVNKIFAPFMKPLFNVSGTGAYPFIMGILSGYPVGAKCTVDLYQKGCCKKGECERLLAFCNNSGPLFILGAVGAGMLENVQIGRYLYIIHILSAFITGIVFRFYKMERVEVLELPVAENIGWSKVVVNSFLNATESIISVCGYVILFSVIGSAITKIGISPIIYGLLEITGGAERIVNMSEELTIKLPILSGIIAFSGFSVMLQVMSIVSKTNLSARLYVIGKAVQGVIAFVLMKIALKIFPITVSVSASDVIGGSLGSWQTSLMLSGIILIFLVIIKKKAVDN